MEEWVQLELPFPKPTDGKDCKDASTNTTDVPKGNTQ